LRAFPLKPRANGLADPARPKGQTPVTAWNLLGCHRVYERESGAKPPLALHHLVTALSVKKALMGWLSFDQRGTRRHRPGVVMRPAHTLTKMHGRLVLLDCLDRTVKE
jgi:hypothetical protein